MKRIVAAFVLAGCLILAGEKTVFKADFQNDESLKVWRAVTYKIGATFHADNGTLTVTHHSAQRRGGFIEIPVPLIKKGRLDFDVCTPTGGQGIGLTLDLYNISTFWHDACKDWRLYFPEPNANRLPYFTIEPVGHHSIGKVPKGETIHYRIRFDESADLVEFFIGDMDDPAAVRFDVSVFGRAFYQQPLLRLGSFGYAPSVYSTTISNLVLTEETEDTGQKTARDLTLAFDGVSSNIYNMEQLLPKGFRRYVWDSPGANIINTNNCKYNSLPGFGTIDRAKTIVFNDAPNIPVHLQKRMATAIGDGANLLILGGLFTLNKGGFAESPLGQVLPVELPDQWRLAGSEKPLPIVEAKPGTLPQDVKPGVCYYYLDLPPVKDAEVLLRAGQDGPPLLVRRRCGNGAITVLLATPCGPDTPNAFWHSKLVQSIISRLPEM
ncbi:MAG: hypothetical protein IJS15_08655 [Victivallales bacterium]|nr:hypothetical protein [Victivallales bacterium]